MMGTSDFYKLVEVIYQRIIAQQKQEQSISWLTKKQAMELLHIQSPTTLRLLVNEGKIMVSRLSSKKIYYCRNSILKYLEMKKEEVF
jgi:hypothetical protein